jgi:hypothetical protein
MGVIENMKDIADLIKKAGDIELYQDGGIGGRSR